MPDESHDKITYNKFILKINYLFTKIMKFIKKYFKQQLCDLCAFVIFV